MGFFIARASFGRFEGCFYYCWPDFLDLRLWASSSQGHLLEDLKVCLS